MSLENSPFRTRGRVLGFVRELVHVLRRIRLRLVSRGRVSFGAQCWIARQSDIRCHDFCEIGDRVSIGKNFTLESNLRVGSEVLISSNVSIIANDHMFHDPQKTVFSEGRTDPVLVTLEGDNLIGYGAILIGPANIGRGCIVGAGAVVTGDLPNNSICVGVPAKPIKRRFPTTSSE